MQKQTTIYYQKEKIFNFFLFINTKSGNGEGKSYLSQNFRAIKFKYQSNRIAIVNLCDLFNKQEKEKSIKLVKECINLKEQQLRIIICGGDGTILWVVNQIKNNGINIDNVVFGINPIGTGNDFSRSVGWGYSPFNGGKKIKQQLAKQVLKWMNASVSFYDLWDVEVQTFQNGAIYDIKDKIQIMRNQRFLKKTFSNYVGIGLDARVVYSAERQRTKSAFFNKVVYCLIGTCFAFKSMKKLEEVMDSFIIQQKSQVDSFKDLSKTANYYEDQISDIRSIIDKKPNQEGSQMVYPIKNGYRGLVCLNCPSYMAGLRHVWQTKNISAINQQQKQNFTPQKFNDGKIQFVSYKNQINLALERIMRSGAKVAQGSGPFKVLMKKCLNDQDTYMQIDGQSIRVVNLKSVRFSKSEINQGGNLKIIVNPED